VTTLRGTWELRNAAADTLIRVEYQLRDLLTEANADEVVALLEAFSPARSTGPEWSRTFDALVERLWAWSDPSVLADAEANFRARGQPWAAVANALLPDHGEHLRQRLRSQSPPSRLPPFILG
jgi:hypothetical protein